MRLYCQYSGVNFTTELANYLPEHTYVHPIFTVPSTILLKQRGNWFAGRIESEVDRKLLFLALLNSTEQVEFHYPAAPSDKVVQSNFPRLFEMADWILRLKTPSLVLPRFRITKETAVLDNVRYWLECWQQERTQFEEGYRNYEEDKKNLERERILERNIKNPTKRAEQYAGLLATWALSASGAPESKRKYWRELFLLKEPALYSANPDHISELYEWLESELEPGSIYSHKALWYVKSLITKVRGGWSGILGIFDNDEGDERTHAAIFQIDDDLQRANTLSVISKAPSQKPERHLYPSEVAYIKANIAWNMKERMLKEQKEAALHAEIVQETTQRSNSDTSLYIAGETDGIN
jgi:hypothetical protein